MKYKKDIETKIRHYSSTIQPMPPDSSPTTIISVTEKLAKLRTEQARAAANRQRRNRGESSSTEQQQMTYHIHPWPGFDLRIGEQQPQPQPQPLPRPAAGPPPPPSWTRRRGQMLLSATTTTNDSNLSFQHYRTQQQKSLEKTTTCTIPSLIRICCWQLAVDHFTTIAATSALDESSRWIDQIKKIPNHVKQRILFEWSFYDDDDEDGHRRGLVTNAAMAIFEKTEYEELWLEASQVSLERLIRAFWKIKKLAPMAEDMGDEPVDDWEDLLSKEDGYTITATTTTLESNKNTTTSSDGDDDDPPPTTVFHLDSQEEIGKWKHLSYVISVLRRQQHQILPSMAATTSTTTISPSYALLSPFLGRTLVSLNISFMRPAPSSSSAPPLCWTTFAHLIASTLPHLHWLYSAGCFNQSQGPEVLTILSHGLRKLKFWDLGYHSWLQLDPLTSVIDWQRDLMELTTLCLSPSTSVSSDITIWFKNHQLGRIKLIWADI